MDSQNGPTTPTSQHSEEGPGLLFGMDEGPQNDATTSKDIVDNTQQHYKYYKNKEHHHKPKKSFYDNNYKSNNNNNPNLKFKKKSSNQMDHVSNNNKFDHNNNETTKTNNNEYMNNDLSYQSSQSVDYTSWNNNNNKDEEKSGGRGKGRSRGDRGRGRGDRGRGRGDKGRGRGDRGRGRGRGQFGNFENHNHHHHNNNNYNYNRNDFNSNYNYMPLEANLQINLLPFLKPEEQIIFQNKQINTTKSNDKIIYQISYFDDFQCRQIKDNNIPMILLFGDNENDKFRPNEQRRKATDGQAFICGGYDRCIAYGFVTVFYNNVSIETKKEIWRKHFMELKDKIKLGYRLVIPTPHPNDLNICYSKYFENNQQVIFHNLGTGVAGLGKQELIFIQQILDDLQNGTDITPVFQYVSKFSDKPFQSPTLEMIPKSDEIIVQKEIDFYNNAGFVGQGNKFNNLLGQYMIILTRYEQLLRNQQQQEQKVQEIKETIETKTNEKEHETTKHFEQVIEKLRKDLAVQNHQFREIITKEVDTKLSNELQTFTKEHDEKIVEIKQVITNKDQVIEHLTKEVAQFKIRKWQWRGDEKDLNGEHIYIDYSKEISDKIESLKPHTMVPITIHGTQYELYRKDENEGVQINVQSKFKRLIKCQVIEKTTELPDWWKHGKEGILTLSDQSNLAQECLLNFYKTCPKSSWDVLKIVCFQNIELWQKHKALEISWDKHRKLGNKLNVLMLWHGTPEDTVKEIANCGFLRDFNTKHAYGKGVYFARDASYSMQTGYAQPNASNRQYILFCRVIAGEWAEGKSTYIRPPKKPNRDIEYESLVDSMSSPTIYVAPTDNQAYACVLLEVEKKKSVFNLFK